MTRYVGVAGVTAAGRDAGYARCDKDLYREVVPAQELALKAAPDKALGHLFLAGRAEAAGDLPRALEHLAQALAEVPERAEVRLFAGLFALRTGDLAGAEPHLEGLGDDAAKVALAIARSRLGRPEEALSALDGVAGDDGVAALARAVALARAGRHDEAAAAFERLAAHPTLGAEAAHDRAALAYYRNQGPVAATGDTPEGALLMGLVALAGGDAAGAFAPLGRALALAPGYLRARLALGQAHEESGRLDEAAHETRQAVGLDARCAEARDRLGAILARAGRADEAAVEYRRAAALRDEARKALSVASETRKDVRAPRRVAVVELINASKQPEHAWLSFGIAEAVSTDLAQLTALEVVERGQVAALMREIKFASMDFVDATTAPKIGQVLGVEALVVGSFQVAGDQIRIDGRLVEIATQRVLESGMVDGPLSELFALERELGMALVGRWASVDDAGRRAFEAAPRGDVGGLEQLALTRMKMLSGDEIGAREAWRAAVERSPELAQRVDDLRGAYQEAEARVAVVPFKNVSGAADSDWIGVGLAESLATDLRKIGLPVVERAEIAKVMTERKFGQIVEPERAAKVGLTVGAQVILIGSYQAVGEMLAIDARMVQVETGAVALSERVSGQASELIALQRELAGKIAKALELQVSVEELAALMGEAPDLEAFKQGVLKDRLFVMRETEEPGADPDEGASVAPVVVGLSGLAAGLAGGILFSVAEGEARAADHQLTLYRRAVDPTEMATRYARASDHDDTASGLRIGSYVLFGVAGAAAIYTVWALIDGADEAPETRGSLEVVTPTLTPTLGPDGIGAQLRWGF